MTSKSLKLCQLELHSENLEASIRFFTEVFGWPAVPIAIHEYTVLQVPDDYSFGVSIVSHTPEAKSPHRAGAVPYFATDVEAETLIEKAKQCQGRVVWGPRFVPGYGTLYLLEDPGGIRIGVYRKTPQ